MCIYPPSEVSCQVVPVAERIFLPLRQRRQLWRCDEDGVLAALGLINFYQAGFLRPIAVHLQQQSTLVFKCLDQLSDSSQECEIFTAEPQLRL